MIRKAEPSDLEALMGIWLDANVQAHSFIPAGYWQGCYAAVREMLPQAELYVHQGAAGEADAFLGLQGDYIAGLFVREEARGRGAGKQLFGPGEGPPAAAGPARLPKEYEGRFVL